ncbi:UDPglucose 6-dehydrogenase [Pseudomonas sp. NFACC32-1]|uniref:UDP-glucose dehydrogenase family protein n=1 Tax=unclassified Pseudomonas TaxID=196821 RepID=UPI00087723E3|nr:MULTISPECIES: UDP-glucose/GDP-mannose dehydrogenase family protein [unclassified Pseudomonas]MDB6443489.1 UDP-glucose/GDP-mannose dehydrogenase family protein [Pseudomonas sp. 21TX0197]ROO35895.1 UDP-glucose 6-dehydrogenase [Pseudomonas sp. 7SR1]SCX40748.1 UDPglucose 6-dehydrogenase [Pseudomonas sp. NFACC32-1]SFX05888.1 UDPglucose 6-dehydrogenase [Pseudomonas sp. NFACC49-2]SFX20736.1 UDPglucose 6-dehydrogenase [Pseudomonas sp. NFACC36]
MKITVFGSGYVGLVTGACLADVGHSVICIDINKEKIDALNRGVIPIYEPGLDELILNNVQAGRLKFSTDAVEGVEHGYLQFIAVGTPPDEDGKADLQYVLAVARSIGQYMNSDKLIIDKSTVPVGTADRVKAVVQEQLDARNKVIDFNVCSNPEFLKEGAAIDDFTKGPRIIVGTDSEKVADAMRQCYAPYNRNHDKIMFMDIRSAELTKYAANSMLATKISFMNELANLAECLDADIESVRLGIGSDPRIGYHFIYPGCGYGGSCFPKDVQALARTAQEVGYDPELLLAVEAVNNRQKEVLFKKLTQAFDGQLKGKCIALWGLAFKPNTDDMRDAPSRTLMEALWSAGASVRAHDPEAMEECRRIYGVRDDLVLCHSREDAVDGADALVICTEWKAYRALEPEWLKKVLRYPIVVDGRNVFNPDDMAQAGLLYFAIGRGLSGRDCQ